MRLARGWLVESNGDVTKSYIGIARENDSERELFGSLSGSDESLTYLFAHGDLIVARQKFAR